MPASLEQLVQQAVSAGDRAAQLRAVATLAADVGTASAAVFDRLRSAGPDGPRLALDLVGRLPDPIPADLVRAALPLIADRALPVHLRVNAAAKALVAVPDDPRSVGPVLRAVTAGLSRARTLERLLHLQSKVGKCDALDAEVAQTEARVELKCPKCPSRLRRPDLIRHLWHRHRLVFENGQARDPRPLVDRAVTEAAESNDPHLIDRTFDLSRLYYPDVEPRQVFQALAARSSADPTQTDRLLELAAAERAGLCPVCLTAVPDPVPELPPPADVADGRLSADGYAAEVRNAALGRVAVVEVPGEPPDVQPVAGPRRSPRLTAALVALPVFLLAVVAVVIAPSRVAGPFAVAGWLAGTGWLLYLAVRLTRPPLPDPTDRAVDLTWTEIVPGIGRSPAAVRFLTRLARASFAAGDPVERAMSVHELVEHAAVLADKGGEYVQFLAAVRVLQVLDAARLGREKVAGLVGVFEPFFRGELPPAYAEAAAELVLESDALLPGEAGRLGVGVIAAGFEAGSSPADLATLTRFCPWTRVLMLDGTADEFGQWYVVWRGRNSRPWSVVGEAATVFELAREFPAASRRILADHPDCLLRVELDERTEAALGPVLVTTRGVVAGGELVADPGATVEVVRSGGGWRLVFGPHRIPLGEKVSPRVADQLRGWLRYRTEKLLPAAEQSTTRGVGARVRAILTPLAVACPLCGTVCVHRVGRLGTPWQAFGG